MAWFKREKKGIITSTEEKKEAPDGLWNKCPNCKKALHYADQVENKYVCHYCGYHLRIGSKEYFSVLFDNNQFTELFANLRSGDPLEPEILWNSEIIKTILTAWKKATLKQV
jgi:acetyl-CoA carboxylase carboxyl transferase subunit beta